MRDLRFGVLAGLATGTLLLVGTPAFGQAYVGPENCRACHAEAYDAWANSPHARAQDSLTGKSAKDGRCLQCHAPQLDKGVGQISCESCHGAGQYYAPAYVMKDSELARAVERRHLIPATDVAAVDDDLREGVPTGLRHQALAPLVVGARDEDLLERHFALGEEGLGPHAERAALGGVDGHVSHARHPSAPVPGCDTCAVGMIETEAVVLRGVKYGEADVILALLTPGMGRVSAIAKGARRPTSKQGGRLQPIAANPDGSIWNYRIIDPRQFILSTSFDL